MPSLLGLVLLSTSSLCHRLSVTALLCHCLSVTVTVAVTVTALLRYCVTALLRHCVTALLGSMQSIIRLISGHAPAPVAVLLCSIVW